MTFFPARALAAATLATLPLLAGAQATANLALASNYKFRGQDQDMLGPGGLAKTAAFKPAVQGGFDYTFGGSGFYLGNWNSSVNWLTGNSVEMDLYGGYRFKAGPLDADLGALTYYYPGATRGNTTELYGALAHADEVLGTVTFKYAHTVSRDYFNYAGSRAGSGLEGRGTGYLNLAYTREVAPKFTLKLALGYTRMSADIRSLGYRSYADYSLGGAYDLGGGFSLAGALQGASQQAAYRTPGTAAGGLYSPNRSRFVLTLGKTL